METEQPAGGAILTGTPLVQVWKETTGDEDDKLQMLSDLSKSLKEKSVIDRTPQTLYVWCARGIRMKDSDQRIKLRNHMVGRYMHSSVRWVKEFLAYQTSEGSSS